MTKQEYFDRKHNCYFMDDPKQIAEYCKIHWTEEVEHILRVADEVSRNYFLFDLKWDMERTYVPVDFGEGPIQWDLNPTGDPEFIWQFNRHRFFICLGQAYQLTGNEGYVESFVRLLKDWIKNAPRIEGTNVTTWRTIEAGLRGEYWTKAFYYFKDSPLLTDEVVNLFYDSMIEHAEYLMETDGPFHDMSNWGVLENHGLFEIAIMLPQTQRSREYIATAIKRLEGEAKLQVMNDGVHWEQSPMYHNEVYHCFLDVMILAKRNKIELPKSFTERVKRMAYANLAWKKPDHHQIMQGDSDDSDIRDLISVGAYVFADPILKFGGFDRLDFESVWDLGIEATKEYEALASIKPEYSSIALSDSGNYYMRSSWDENANLLHFHCGTLGAGHSHAEKLHVDIVINGEDILMDSGRFTYVDGVDRYEFKDPMAHNVVTVDHELFTICKDSWNCSKLSQPIKQTFALFDHYEFVQGGHLGYMDLESSTFVNRKVIHIKPDIYILVDEMYTSGTHEYQQYFHFNNRGQVSLSKENVATYSGETTQANVYFLSEGISCEKIPTRISRTYNLTEPQETIKTSFQKDGFASAITVVHGGIAKKIDSIKLEKIPVKSVLKNRVFSDDKAEAIKISIREKTYVVIICHQEVISPVDLIEADGCSGMGNVIVFEKGEGVKGGTVLNW